MYFSNIKRIIGPAVVLTVMLALNSNTTAQTPQEIGQPDVPCTEVQVPAGNRLASHAYAIGVQMYRWNGTRWVFVEPVAGLFANELSRGSCNALRRPDVGKQ